MALTKTTVAVNNITALSDTPNATEGLTAAQLKAKFDKTGSDLKTYINDILTAEIDASVSTIESGWTAVPVTLTYASTTTINTSVDLTSYIGVGDKLKLTQTSVKYFYVTAITNSLITVTGTGVVSDAAITSPYYSHQENPLGFPAKPKARATNNANQENLTNATPTLVALQTESYDVGGNFASNTFTAPISGYYWLNGSVTFLNTVATKLYIGQIYVNGNSVCDDYKHSSLTASLCCKPSTKIYLTKGDTVNLYANALSADNTSDIIAGTRFTFLECQFIEV